MPILAENTNNIYVREKHQIIAQRFSELKKELRHILKSNVNSEKSRLRSHLVILEFLLEILIICSVLVACEVQ